MASPDILLPSRPLFSGEWTYRSYLNNPDPAVEPNDLLFGLAAIRIEESGSGLLIGTLGGAGWSLSIEGQASYSPEAATAKWQGTGTIGAEHWVYDYFAYYSPAWANGVDQTPAMIGTVVRTVEHGTAAAGVTAQFIAVQQR